MVWSGPVARRRASGTMTMRWWCVGGAQAVVDQREVFELGLRARRATGRCRARVASTPLTALML